jgi:hypothetical protein
MTDGVLQQKKGPDVVITAIAAKTLQMVSDDRGFDSRRLFK